MPEPISKTHPVLAAELHPTKNGDLTADDLFFNSSAKVWWLCSLNPKHEWETVVSRRTSQGSGCLYCAGKIVLPEDSLAGLFPAIAAEWHPSKNFGISADTIRPKSNRKFWWLCPKNPTHEWETTPAHRTSYSTTCPICRSETDSTLLLPQYLELKKEFHPTLNVDIKLEDVRRKCKKRIWWQCSKNESHVWQAMIETRIRGGKCPVCNGNQTITGKRIKQRKQSVAEVSSKLTHEWHPTLNGKLSPFELTAGSIQKVWWRCSNDSSHEWVSTIYNRTRGRGCPKCAPLANNKTLLVDAAPSLAAEWHPTKNKLSPSEVSHGSAKKVWWQCSRAVDHVWLASVNARYSGNGCPFCSSHAVSEKSSLANKYPNIAAEWHPQKNGSLTPETVTSASGRKIWWRCTIDPSHEWLAVVRNRTLNGSGCPACNQGWSVNAIRGFVSALKGHLNSFTPAELYLIFQQNGLLGSGGKGKSFINSLATGRFPFEEIEKFCNGQDSLVDAFLLDRNHSLETLPEEKTAAASEPETLLGDEQLGLFDALTPQTTPTLPVVQTKDVLAALQSTAVTSADQEAVEFLVASGVAKAWRHAFRDETAAVSQASAFRGDNYAEQVRSTFLREYQTAKEMQIPVGYSFKVDNVATPPNLMQRLVATRTLLQRRVGNWSGTGAGKTLSAILASRLTRSNLTLICCPNSVVGGWQRAIAAVFPDSLIGIKTFTPDWTGLANDVSKFGLALKDCYRYLIMNYEAFQAPDSAERVKTLASNETFDFIVIDEIHYTKQRYVENVSRRKQVIAGLVALAGEKNKEICVLGMSATPVINNLQEGKSLVELVTGTSHDDLGTKPTVANCMRLHQRLVTLGARWVPEYDVRCVEHTPQIDIAPFIYEIRGLERNGTTLQLEQILTQARLPSILEHVQPKTLIYTHYIQEIDKTLRDALTDKGWRVGFFTGEDKSGLEAFIEGDLDVLIGSSAIGTGVDGLQHVCNRLIVNVLPWTNAEYEQLKGRVYRQGQTSRVDVIVPITFAEIHGQRWSWCESKMNRLRFKKSISDAAVDGVVPEGHLRSTAQAYQDAIGWLERLESGQLQAISRHPIQVPIPHLTSTDAQKLERRYGDFSALNRKWNQSHSSKTNERLKEDPEEWMQYHTLYGEARKDWAIVPFEEMIRWFKRRSDYVIGDFGCGEAWLAKELSSEHTVYSFDYLAINEDVVECDMAHVPLDEGTLDAAVFSLSLMGSNFIEYLREAHRTLKLDGQLHIIEATSRFNDRAMFTQGLKTLGFAVVDVDDWWKFTHIHAVKTDREFDLTVCLNF